MWIIVLLSFFERPFFSRRTQVELKRWAAIFRCYSESVFTTMRALSRSGRSGAWEICTVFEWSQTALHRQIYHSTTPLGGTGSLRMYAVSSDKVGRSDGGH